MQITYYTKLAQLLLGIEQHLDLDSRMYKPEKGHFDVVAETGSVIFVPNNPESFTATTVFKSALSKYTLRLIVAILRYKEFHDPHDDVNLYLSDLERVLIKELDYKPTYEAEYFINDSVFLRHLDEFSRFDSPSYLVSSENIVNFVKKYSFDYADFIDNHAIPSIKTRDLLHTGLWSVADYLYFKVTPKIIDEFSKMYVWQYNNL